MTVAFEDRALSFMLSKNATFEELPVGWTVSVSGTTASRSQSTLNSLVRPHAGDVDRSRRTQKGRTL